jgi:WhiB family redox-sensing transcriptional regulator
VQDTNWMAKGKCREQHRDTFFPRDGVGVEISMRICAVCPVRELCLEYALFHSIEHGVWGRSFRAGAAADCSPAPVAPSNFSLTRRLAEYGALRGPCALWHNWYTTSGQTGQDAPEPSQAPGTLIDRPFS